MNKAFIKKIAMLKSICIFRDYILAEQALRKNVEFCVEASLHKTSLSEMSNLSGFVKMNVWV